MTGIRRLISQVNASAAALRATHKAWIIFAAALAMRLFQVLTVGEIPTDDTADYDEIALNLLSGEGFVARENWFGFDMYSWRAPAHPFLLAAIYHVFGYDHTAPLIIQALIGAATAVVVYDLGRHLHPASAFLAGGLVAVYGPLIRATSTLSTEPLFILLTVTAVHQLTLSERLQLESTHLRYRLCIVLCGILIAAAALTRPVGLVLLPVQVGIWYWRARAVSGRGSGWFGRSLWLSLGVVVLIAPWTLRNYRVHDALVPISTHGGFIFAHSKTSDPDWRKKEQAWRIDREVFERMPTEIVRDRYWIQQGLDYIRTNPAHYVQLVGECLLRFWYFFEPQYNFWFMSVLPFCLAGVVRYGGRDRYLLLTSLITASIAVFTLILYASVRFRLTLEPFFLLYASSYLRDYWDRLGPERSTRTIGLVVLLNGLIWWQDEVLRRLLLGFIRQWNLG